jgi:hypothetical protein
MKMNLWFLAGGLFTGIATVIHTIGGQKTNIKHIKESEVPSSEKIEFYGVWHLISGNFLIGTLTLLLIGVIDFGDSGNLLALFISVNYIFYLIIFLVISVIETKWQFYRVPQLYLVVLMGILPLIGILQ